MFLYIFLTGLIALVAFGVYQVLETRTVRIIAFVMNCFSIGYIVNCSTSGNVFVGPQPLAQIYVYSKKTSLSNNMKKKTYIRYISSKHTHVHGSTLW